MINRYREAVLKEAEHNKLVKQFRPHKSASIIALCIVINERQGTAIPVGKMIQAMQVYYYTLHGKVPTSTDVFEQFMLNIAFNQEDSFIFMIPEYESEDRETNIAIINNLKANRPVTFEEMMNNLKQKKAA
jgi:hypothetical protein